MDLDRGASEDSGILRVVTRRQGTTSVIELVGEWDLAGAPAADRAIAAALDGSPECVVLDLSRLTFIDSSGLHATIELAQRAAREAIPLAIIVGSPVIRRPFELSGLTKHLPLIDVWSVRRTARSRIGATAGPGGASLPASTAGCPPTAAGAEPGTGRPSGSEQRRRATAAPTPRRAARRR